ncbi:MAG: YdcF family protein [Proteobacteria bacterium]|nr:YdcF family protein [Pseudomonadota bacterium]
MSPGEITIAIARTLILPPVSLFVLYGIGLILQIRHPRPGHYLRVASMFLLFLLSTQAGAWLFMRPLENLEKPLTSATGAQAIVVLGAGRLRNSPEYGGKDIPDYIALARLRYTAKLHRETGLPVLVSGGCATDTLEPLANGMVSALQDDFATPVKWIEKRSFNTAENAVFSAQILKQAGIQRILLVTDAMHMPRARMAFERQGLVVIAAPTLFFANNKPALTDLIPGVEPLRRANYAIYEWLGIVWYHYAWRINQQ